MVGRVISYTLWEMITSKIGKLFRPKRIEGVPFTLFKDGEDDATLIF